MIARNWRGVTLASTVDNYLEFLIKIMLPKYQAADGCRGVLILEDTKEEMAHILLLSLWDSREALTKFAGPDIEIAKYNAEERDFLIAYESMVKHYQVMNWTV
jgi:hypothetical protein